MNGVNRLLQTVALFMTLVGLAGCYTLIDMSPKGLQKMWLEWVRDGAIGKNIYECKRRKVRTSPCAVFLGGDQPLTSKKFNNGNIEDEYSFSLSLKMHCHYYYEYEMDTGRIVGFRFEESEQYACRITGA